mgnify:FL=1
MTIEEKDREYVASTYARFPVRLVRGEGATLYDADGKSYIDLGSGIGVSIFGTADVEWAAAVSAQLRTLQHASNLYYTDPCVLLAEALCKRSGMKKVFFSNSGAEANECAIKTARKWGEEHKGAEYYNIAVLKGGFHGRTLAALAATGQEEYHKDFLPLTPGFVCVDAEDAEGLERAVTENKCAAVMLETIQGEGGVVPLSEGFLHAAADIAAKHGVLLIIDEVQTGMGRTGKFYSYMHYGITPDIVTSAKGLGGGLPIGATLFGERTADVLTPGTHGSTFGGNPAVCAGALNIVGRLTDEFLGEVAEKGEKLRSYLAGSKGIKNVTGRGLMLGVAAERPAADVLARLRDEGVLALKAKDKVRLLPPLNITAEELDRAAEIIKKVCAE